MMYESMTSSGEKESRESTIAPVKSLYNGSILISAQRQSNDS